MGSITLSDALDAQFEQLAARTHQPKTFHVTEALLHYLEELEDAAMLAERTLKTDSRFYTNDEVATMLANRTE
jgi:predicted transcriptional regulator